MVVFDKAAQYGRDCESRAWLRGRRMTMRSLRDRTLAKRLSENDKSPATAPTGPVERSRELAVEVVVVAHGRERASVFNEDALDRWELDGGTIRTGQERERP